jgi:hypothetical protein
MSFITPAPNTYFKDDPSNKMRILHRNSSNTQIPFNSKVPKMPEPSPEKATPLTIQ